jgi:hypothetical protein
MSKGAGQPRNKNACWKIQRRWVLLPRRSWIWIIRSSSIVAVQSRCARLHDWRSRLAVSTVGATTTAESNLLYERRRSRPKFLGYRCYAFPLASIRHRVRGCHQVAVAITARRFTVLVKGLPGPADSETSWLPPPPPRGSAKQGGRDSTHL